MLQFNQVAFRASCNYNATHLDIIIPGRIHSGSVSFCSKADNLVLESWFHGCVRAQSDVALKRKELPRLDLIANSHCAFPLWLIAFVKCGTLCLYNCLLFSLEELTG